MTGSTKKTDEAKAIANAARQKAGAMALASVIAGAFDLTSDKQKPLADGKPFEARGFSEKTIKAILDCGIDSPERLLFMDETTIKKIPGVGKAAFAEIKQYRDRFIIE